MINKSFPKVYISILNYRNFKDTIECLESVKLLNYPNFNVLVIDNNSGDDSERQLKKWVNRSGDKRFIFIQTGENKGYAGGNNRGIQFALKKGDMDYFWILNNDTIVDQNALIEIINKFKKDPQIGICGSKLVSYWDRKTIQNYGLIYNKFTSSVKNIIDFRHINKLDYICGASMCLSKRFIDKIGLLSEDYFLYYEELDLAERAKDKFKIACAPKSIVYHKEGQSINNKSDGNKESKIGNFYSFRNRIIFSMKYHPFCLPTVYLWMFLLFINKLRKGQKDTAHLILSILLHPKMKYNA